MKSFLSEYPEILSVQQVAAIMGVSVPTIRRHIKKKEIPSVHIGRLTRIPRDLLVEYLSAKVDDQD